MTCALADSARRAGVARPRGCLAAGWVDTFSEFGPSPRCLSFALLHPNVRVMFFSMGEIKREILKKQDETLRPARLADLVEKGIGVICWCHRCNHHASEATEQLVARLGQEFPVPEIGGAVMKCGKCGSRDVATSPDCPDEFGVVARHSP